MRRSDSSFSACRYRKRNKRGKLGNFVPVGLQNLTGFDRLWKLRVAEKPTVLSLSTDFITHGFELSLSVRDVGEYVLILIRITTTARSRDATAMYRKQGYSWNRVLEYDYRDST